MANRSRRWFAVISAVGITVAVAAMRPAPGSRQLFRITLGQGDPAGADWSGTLAVSEGALESLTGRHFEGKDQIESNSAWRCRTYSALAPGARYPLTLPSEKP